MSRYKASHPNVIDNMLLGHGIMVSILDLFMKNPYTRIPNIDESLEVFRK